VKWGADLQSEHERFLAEEHVGRPVIVTDYPAAIKAFYMYLNDDERTCARWTCSCRRSARSSAARSASTARTCCGAGSPRRPRPAHYGWYLDLRRFGSAPHAGFGLGFERIVQFMTGMKNIRDVIPFPRVPGYAEF
jgi:asparaginyl-tRNA synthetase